jgi:hypothetical protein
MNKNIEMHVPNLEEMDEQEAWRFLVELFTNLSPEAEYAARHEDFVMEMPQSGERIRGRENMRAFQRSFADHSNPPAITLRRVVVREGLWILEGVNDYGNGRVFDIAAIFELRDGRIWRDTRYYAEPFEGPQWRAQWVERFEPGAPPQGRRVEA